ncbi:hypothetical protein VULLAG_LOCUS4378 [Vulpes lagopus]
MSGGPPAPPGAVPRGRRPGTQTRRRGDLRGARGARGSARGGGVAAPLRAGGSQNPELDLRGGAGAAVSELQACGAGL